MKFRTEVEIKNAEIKIEKSDKIFSIGSCFSTEMTDLLAKGQLQTYNNPFGTLFNPFSINKSIEKIANSIYYTADDLIKFEGQYISLDHYTGFNSDSPDKTLDAINFQIKKAAQFLKETKWVIITYGSSFVYKFLPKNKLIGNCHKIPQKFFEKQFLSNEEIINAIKQSIELLGNACHTDVQILFTISPVRHTKDGIVENNLSKAKLISALHEVIEQYENCSYLPVYELMIDDLRDYRFYKDDMIHPSNQAVNYIFEKFGNAYFSEDTMDFLEENFKINQSLQHRPSDINNPKYIEFTENLKKKIQTQQAKVNHTIFSK